MKRVSSFILMCLLQILTVAASPFNLKVEVAPAGAATPNTQGGTYEEGEVLSLRLSTHTGFIFKGWYVNEDVVSSTVNFNYTMPSYDVCLKAIFEYDPDVPANPAMPDTTTYFSLTATPSPMEAAKLNLYEGKYPVGASINMRSNGRTGYVFDGWQNDRGETLSSSSSFNFNMPAQDTHLTAIYHYDPTPPSNPEQTKNRYSLTVEASPAGAGRFSCSSDKVASGEEYNVYAYPSSGYRFKGWIVNGVAQEETSTTYRGVMTESGAQVIGLFEFDPTPPANPGTNHYNPTTGQTIIDDFSPGYLYDALQYRVGWDNFSKVSSLIVKGQMNSGDFGILSYLNNAATIDLSRVGGITLVPGYAFNELAAASILLPSTIGEIGKYAFQNCKNLTSVTLYSLNPPTCTSYTFGNFPNKDNCSVYVPREAMELYANADYWKDFTILPIMTDAHVLQVNLPEDAADGRYKHNSIEIVNQSSGVRQKYVISDRLVYTFNNLQKDEQYNVYMLSQSGLEIGRIENVVIPNDDIEVTFEDLKTLHTAVAKVMTPDGSDVTSQVNVEWLKPLEDGTATYLRKATSISEIPEGEQLLCRIELDSKLGMVYVNPEDVAFTVSGSDNNCIVNLVPFRMIGLSGIVVDGDGSALSGASVSASQMLNGKYSKTCTAKTDRKGEWKINVFDAPQTNLTFAASECVNVNDTIGAFDSGIVSFDWGKTIMKSIVGARVSYGFTYHAAGEENVETYYPDYQNVAISVYNETQDRPHNEVSVQYPLLAVLDENINAGDKLKLTATSKAGAFNPIVETVTIGDDQRAEVTFDIVGKGGIQASFEMTENPAVTAMLYSDKGELVKKQTYSEAKTTFTGLDAGNYTLVSMGQSDLMNSILRLANFAEIGLTEGKDYVVNSVMVESGILTEVKNQEIPAFDESVFYYTNSTTNFSTNKSSITTGNYLTLRAAIDFKGVYKNDISNVALVVDLPEACDFVEQSVIQGPNLLPYTLDNNRLTIQLGDNYQNQTRFCVVPTSGGSFNASASIIFDYNGKSITQPIGSAMSSIKDIEITVPSVIASPIIPVRGVGRGGSVVKVFADGLQIGETKILANGTWHMDCPLVNPCNLKKFTLEAFITTPDGVDLRTASKTVVYDKNVIYAKTVTMTFYNGWLKKNVDVVFDFETKTTSASSYMFYTTTNLTFIADLSQNSSDIVSSVNLYVFTDKNEKREISLSYDETLDKWIGTSQFSSDNLPINMGISINGASPIQHDRSLMSEISGDWKNKREEATDILNTIEQEEQYEKEQEQVIDSEIKKNKEIIGELLSALETGIDENSVNEYYSKIGIDTTQIMTDIPENADMDWLNGILDKGDVIVATALKTGMSEEEYQSLLFQSEAVLADESVIDAKLAFSSIIQERIDLMNDSDVEFSFYQIDLSELSDDIIVGCDTTSMLMTDGPDVLFLINEEKGVTVIADEYNNTATVIINHEVASSVRAYVRKARKKNDFVAAMEEASKEANNLYNSLISFFLGAIDEVNTKINNLKGVISNIELKQTEVLGQSAGTKMQIQDVEVQLRTLKNQKVVDLNEYQRIKNQIADLTAQRQSLLKEYNRLGELNKGLTKQLNKMRPLLTGSIVILGQLNELKGIVQGIIDFVSHAATAIQDHNRWHSLINAIEPCEGDAAKASRLKVNCENDWSDLAWSKGYYPSIAFTGIATTVNGILFARKDLRWLVGFIGGIITNFLDNTASVMFDNATSASAQWYPKRYAEYQNLKCEKRKEPKPTPPKKDWPRNDGNNNGNDGNDDNNNGGDFDPINPIHDPSGYVYEAVLANRVEGVQTTIYYKETKEDMYGDPYEEIVLWDAEEYAQKNPLFTDENGMYQWDVPQGLWQVKFEKDGYATAYSEWLPVPPPQLEVNIGIVQNKQPEVIDARAYEDGIEVQFDKYMDLSTLNTSNIYVTANGEKLNGEVTMVDSALADEYASENDANATRYASRVRFVPEEKLSTTTGEIRLTVSRNVLSYAGIPMTGTYSQTLDVEKEVKAIVADDVKVLYGGEKEVTISVIPFEAAVNRKLHIALSSDLIASIDKTEAVLDEEGKATIIVKGDLPGRCQLTFSIDDVTETGDCTVDVVTEIITAEAPKSSRASGTAVYRGTKIELTTESKDATIYFTTDGSCPCDENGTRRKYTVPIVINEDTKILAMTSVGNGDDDISEIVEFNYTLKRTDMDFQMEEGWTWISHCFDNSISPATLAEEGDIRRVIGSAGEAIFDPQEGFTGTLTGLAAAESYRVETVSATSRKRISDIAWNPTNPIAIGKGWNWLGYPLGQTMAVNEALASTDADALDVIVGQDGFAQYDGEKWIGTLETMQPGKGYMYLSNTDKKLIYNTAIVSTAAAKSIAGIFGKAPLVVDIHKYCMVMPVVANVCSLDGTPLDNSNYQVAAFCGSECRGVGKVIDGRVMMNVYGETDDSISFKVTDTEGVDFYHDDEALTFSETVIGDLFNPYPITVKDTDGVETIEADSPIKVMFEGEMLLIKGVSADDVRYVEVYDIQGQKLMHETRVPESGIKVQSLTDGIYVVIVNANGDYSYHKIVK
ncbi:MAG: chitobiase/beta-hexosaminidase C-terminal domain-containing protein [Muribaculaceae bacterium]|nr:chitobiase/beta-hexosaminidase C-terminal domain-containing protein [Muribaculaceae bacterium]